MGAAKQVYLSYKSKARRREREFKINFEEFLEITRGNCYWCGDPPSNSANDSKKFYGDYVYSGIDRLDSDVGYVEGNIVPCCIDCNKAKLDHPIEKFLDLIKKIYEKHLKLSS